MKMRSLFFILLFCSIFTSPAQAWRVEQVQGLALVTSNGKDTPIKRGDNISETAQLQTKDTGKLQLVDEKDRLFIGNNTTIKLSGSKPHLLSRGRIRAVIASARARLKEPFSVRTKTAVAGVRGTEFFISSGEDEKFCTLKGLIEVQVEGDKTYQVPAGQGLVITEGKGALGKNSADRVKAWIADTSL